MWQKHFLIISRNLQTLSANNTIPVIAIDGPSASGKGTVAQLVADTLGFHYLDSGAMYRIVALAASQNDIALNNGNALGELAQSLHIAFKDNEIYLNSDCVTTEVRSVTTGRGASEVAVHPQVRDALFKLQKSFRQAPGLVADGRDMASVVFTNAVLKIFLVADVEVRADRRYKQLIKQNQQANAPEILQDLQQRDLRDTQRSVAPLMQTKDALLLDTTSRSIKEAVAFVLSAYKKL